MFAWSSFYLTFVRVVMSPSACIQTKCVCIAVPMKFVRVVVISSAYIYMETCVCVSYYVYVSLTMRTYLSPVLYNIPLGGLHANSYLCVWVYECVFCVYTYI